MAQATSPCVSLASAFSVSVASSRAEVSLLSGSAISTDSSRSLLKSTLDRVQPSAPSKVKLLAPIVLPKTKSLATSVAVNFAPSSFEVEKSTSRAGFANTAKTS